jgi:hypothetical protein
MSSKIERLIGVEAMSFLRTHFIYVTKSVFKRV